MINNHSLKTTIAAVLLLLIILIPLYFVAFHFNSELNLMMRRSETLAMSKLRNEMNHFHQDLVLRTRIESLLKKMEADLGLFPKAGNGLVYDPKDPPGIFNKSTNSKIAGFIKNSLKTKPFFLLSYDEDFRNSYAKYMEGQFLQKDEDKKKLEAAIIGIAMKEMETKSFFGNDTELQKKHHELINFFTDGTKQDNFTTERYFRTYFARFAYPSDLSGICIEVNSSFSSRERLYIYWRCLRTNGAVLGGYFIVLSNKYLSSIDLLKLTLKKKSESIHRRLAKISMVEKFYKNSKELIYQNPPPADFINQIYSGEESQILKNVFEKYSLAVSIPLIDIYGDLAFYKLVLAFLLRISVLFAFFIIIKSLLHGFNFKQNLRRKLVLLSFLMILIPYLLLGYFSGLTLNELKLLKDKEVSVRAESKLYELKQYVEDFKTKSALFGLAKKAQFQNLLDCDQEKMDSFKNTDISNFKWAEDLILFNSNGVSRKFNRHFTSSPGHPKLVERMVSTKCLNNLGVLNKNSSVIKNDLKKVSYAEGFLEGLFKNYIMGTALSIEGSETLNFHSMQDQEKMFYYLIAPLDYSLKKAWGIAFVFGLDISLQQFFNGLSQDSTELVFTKKSPEFSMNLALGRRRHDDYASNIWPRKLMENSEEKNLINYAIKTKSSGNIIEEWGSDKKISAWSFKESDKEVFAGIAYLQPNRLLELVFKTFPIILAIFSLISIILLGDILAVFFVSPVKGFKEAFKRVRDGRFRTRVDILETDEFGKLGASFNKLTLSLLQRERMRRFVSEDLFLQTGESGDNEQSLREMTILSSDIRGFTTISENNDPHAVVELLNDYFSEMESAIKASGGTIQRFVGDAVQAIFYPDAACASAQKAVDAALKMRENLSLLNKSRQDKGLFCIENGIGIASGEAISAVAGGNTGRKVFTVIGELPGKADELETLSKFGKHTKIIVCANTKLGLIESKNLSSELFEAISEDAFEIRKID
jgi:class 3 adenylate cyclase